MENREWENFEAKTIADQKEHNSCLIFVKNFLTSPKTENILKTNTAFHNTS